MLINRFLHSIFLVIAASTSIISEISANTWNCETIIEPKYFTAMSSRSIAVDSNNHPHFAYGGDHLYYAYYDGSPWHYETVDSSPGVGGYASIALDSSGKAHISYYDETNKDLKYATNASGSWVTTTIYNSRNIYETNQDIDSYTPGEGYTSIAVDALDKVHISYYDYIRSNEGDLIYATNESGSWVTTKIDTGEIEDTRAGKYNSIAVDNSSNIHISYCYSNVFYADLRYATNASGKWVISTVDSTGSSGWYSSIALDSSGNAHISYCDHLNLTVNYATNATGSWIINVVDRSYYNSAPSYTSMALDSNNRAHIVYRFDNYHIKYATNTSGKWVTEEVDPYNYSGPYLDGEYISIALDPSDDHVCFSYFETAKIYNGVPLDASYNYAIKMSESWKITTIDNGNWLNDCSLAIDSSGNSHISYIATDNGYLMYATNASGKWEISTVDSGGADPDIALDSSGKVHIGYSNHNLFKYATNKSGTWKRTTIDSYEFLTDTETSIAIDTSGNAHLCYNIQIPVDSTSILTHALKYATNASGSWITTFVDDSDAGWFPSIALDSENKTHISYYAHSSPDPDGKGLMFGGLKYATNVSGYWETAIIDNSMEYIGTYSSIAIDTSDKVHISYSRFFSATIKYATNSSGSWLTKIIDERPLEDVGETSITLDKSDNAHISYYNDPSLKYATNSSGSWITTTLDSGGGGFVGFRNSIALDKFGKLHICYTDDSNGDIKYAISTNQPSAIPVTMEASPAELIIRNYEQARVYITVKGVDNIPVQGDTIKARIKNDGDKLIEAYSKEQTTDVYGQAVFTFYAKKKGKTSVTFKDEALSIKVPVTIIE